MGISLWPESVQPREKLLKQGAVALSDAELLAIFLRTGVAGKSAVDLAGDLLQHYGGLRQLMEADQQQFCQLKGLGPAKYAQLQAVLEMARRHMSASLEKESAMNSPEQVKDYLKMSLRAYPREVFACLLLDNQHRVLKFEKLFYGTINAASVYPREVVRAALQANAAAVVLAHNHPSGVAEPSRCDLDITRQLVSALQLVDIRVLDHMIVGDTEVVSFAERGLL